MSVFGISRGAAHRGPGGPAWFACRYPWCPERLVSYSGYPPECPVHDLPMIREDA
jgi:hypothetical protein